MKKMIIVAMGLLLVATSCRNSRNEVVQESFFHKFGVPVSKDDWVRNGREGSVVQLKKDGVTTTHCYERGILNGDTTHTFANSSTIQMVEKYKEGSVISRRENYLSGVPMKEDRYEGEFIVEELRWYEDGVPASIEHFERGALVKGEYFTPNNALESEVQNGFGTRVIRGGVGELLAKESVKEKETVERVAFFPNGDPASITPFEEGLIHGTRLTFLQGGLPNTLEEWVNGYQEGITVIYVNGEKFAEVTYVKGHKEGIERRFRDGKTVAEEISWKNSLQHGPRTLLNEEGIALQTEWYHEGELVSRPTFERMNLR